MSESLENRHRAMPARFPAISLLIAASVALSAVACGRAESEKLPAASRFGPEVLLSVAPADLPTVVRDWYRLRPDRRLLQAVAAVQRLRTGTAAEPVKAEFQAGRWRILAGRDEVGVLSEIPTFEEATELLGGWAVRTRPASLAMDRPGTAAPATVALEGAIRQVDAAALLDALSSLGGSPADAQRDEAKIRAIASGLAWLSTLTVDKLEQADGLLAEAWAWLALERVSSPARGGASEVLVARALGYEAAAARASSTLAEDDPVRLYATGAEARLAALCAGRPTDRPCHYLRLALLADLDQAERFHSAMLDSPFRDENSLAILGLETRLSDFGAGTSPGRDLAALAMAKVTPSLRGPDTTSPEARTGDFEAAVERLAPGRDEGPVGIAALQASYRAAFYSGLFDEASFALDQLASGPAAQQLAASLTAPAAGTADELRRWIEVNARVLEGSTDMQPVAELVESARSLGAAPLFDLGVTVAEHVGSTDPLRRLPIPALFARLDTRPSHLVMAARAAHRNLLSPGLFEKLARAAAEAAPYRSEELPALVAKMREDSARPISHRVCVPVHRSGPDVDFRSTPPTGHPRTPPSRRAPRPRLR